MSDILEQAKLKRTKKRELILQILDKKYNPMTAEDIFKACTADVNIDLSTIYRALSALSEKGVIVRTIMQDGKTYYQINNNRHGHHLICTSCHNTVAIDACPLKEISKLLNKQTGYTITGHNLEFSGICPDCMKKRKLIK